MYPHSGYQPPHARAGSGREAELEDYAGRISAEKAHLEDHVAKLQAALAGANRHLEQEAAEKRNAIQELLRKEALLKELELQFEQFKEAHAQLLASKLEEQRDAFNLEKDRINQHFIKTGHELHGKNDLLAQQQQDVAKAQQENAVLKDWLDKGVEECRRVADENEKLRGEMWELKQALGRVEGDAQRRISAHEQERDRERGEKDAVSAALQSAQERIMDLQTCLDEDRRHLAEVTTQARRMRRRMATLKQVVDRYTAAEPQQADPLAVLDGDADGVDDIEVPDATEADAARDAMLRLHETVNGVQLATKRLLGQILQGYRPPPPGPTVASLAAAAPGNPPPHPDHHYHPWQQPQQPQQQPQQPQPQQPQAPAIDPAKVAQMEEELEELRRKLVRKKVEVEELEDELDGLRRNRLSASEETEAAQKATRAAQQEADRLREELDRLRLAKEQDTAQSRHQMDLLAEDLRKLTDELEQIRDYGRQVEQDNDELRRALAAHEAAARQHSEEQEQAFKQLEALREHDAQEHSRLLEDAAAKARWQEQQLQQELDQRQALFNQQQVQHQQEIDQLKLLLQQQSTLNQQALDQQRELMSQQSAAHQQAVDQQYQQHLQQTQQLQQQIQQLQAQLEARPLRPAAGPPAATPPAGGGEVAPAPPFVSAPSASNLAPQSQPSAPAVHVHAPQPAAPASAASDAGGRRQQWGPADPDDYGHASPAHAKLSCPLCGAEGFVPGLPCRNCGFSVGQFTRLVGHSGTPGSHAADTVANSAATSPRRWY
eukprot:TRINITY_DN6504_c7_g1_i1.p1 TRINITY_DN6504_c7_g1~~TRINITY_DN6504_c7_g1_i1.p1  ORF type:complete len:807 (+),score=356.24 TRINITY_DN6504_c7_g1_i1:99-2423(+)